MQYYSALHREITSYLNDLFFSQGNIATNKKHGAWTIQISVWCEMPQRQQHGISKVFHNSFTMKITTWCWSSSGTYSALQLWVQPWPEAESTLVQLIQARFFKCFWIHDLSQFAWHVCCCSVHPSLKKRERNFKPTSSIRKGRNKTERSITWQMFISHPERKKKKQKKPWKTPQENKYSKVLIFCDVPNLQSKHNCQTQNPSCLLTHF